MDKYHDKLVTWTRIFRTKKLMNLAKKVAKLGVTANHITTLSLITGITAIYFLYDSYLYFLIFSILHLFLDGFDGVLARVTTTTTTGQYYDTISDNIISFLIIVKTALLIQDNYVYLVLALFFFSILFHLLSKLQAPVIFIRTSSLIGLWIFSHPTFPYLTQTLTAGYLIIGTLALYSLARQLQWYTNS